MFSNGVATSTTAEALRMEKHSHAAQIIAIAYVTFATTTFPASYTQKTSQIKFKIVKVMNVSQSIDLFFIVVGMVMLIFGKSGSNYTEININVRFRNTL